MNQRGFQMKDSRARSSDAKKNAVIALAILVLLLFWWKLMTRPERWGGAGPWLKTNVFGTLGAGLGGGTPTGTASGGGRADDTRTGPGGRGAAAAGTNAPAGEFPGKPADSTVSNNLVKIIADFPDEPQTNRLVGQPSSSPDAAAMARRLGEAGAKGGDLQFSLFWRNHNDLDLHCIDPMGFEIFYNNKISPLTGGELDIDQNFREPYNSSPVENIYWPSGGAPAGLYRVFVVYYAQHDLMDMTTYTVRTVVQNKTNYFTHTMAMQGQRKTHWICTIKYDPENPDPASRCRFMPYQ
jgi:hypothetical protein